MKLLHFWIWNLAILGRCDVAETLLKCRSASCTAERPWVV